MSTQEALKKIRSNPKWYWEKGGNGEYNSNPLLIQTAQRIEDGRAKPKTVKAFFAKFGFEVSYEIKVTEVP